jgi:uncharacterized protein YndB with AHSA1/START domain
MTNRSVAHGSFTIERVYAAPPQRVFAAWASQAAKDRWYGSGDDFLASTDRYTLDFRVGGLERLDGMLPNGHAFGYEAFYQDIVDDERIVMSYDVRVDGRRASVSLMTVELAGVSGGTKLVLTEQGAFLDGLDTNDSRQDGALDSLNKLDLYLEGTPEVQVAT